MVHLAVAEAPPCAGWQLLCLLLGSALLERAPCTAAAAAGARAAALVNPAGPAAPLLRTAAPDAGRMGSFLEESRYLGPSEKGHHRAAWLGRIESASGELTFLSLLL